MKNMNCVSTMPEIMPEITDEAIIEALFAQRPYEEKVINSAFLEIPAEYQRKLNIPNVEKMSAEFTELIANPPKVSYRDGHYFVFDGQHTIVTRRAMNGGQDLPIICKVYEGLTEEPAQELGFHAPRYCREQPAEHPPGVGLHRERGGLPEPRHSGGCRLCGAGRGRAGAELRRGRHPL